MASWDILTDLLGFAIFPIEFIRVAFFYIAWALAIFAAGFLGFYVILTALVMVFSFDRNGLRMFEKIFKNLIWFNGLIFSGVVDLLGLVLQAAQVGAEAVGSIFRALLPRVGF